MIPCLEEPNFNQSTGQTSYFIDRHFTPPLNLKPNNGYNESSFNFRTEQEPSFNFSFPQYEHVCSHGPMANHRNPSHMSGYFF